MRDFLVKKIREVQDRSDPLELDKEIDTAQAGFPKVEEMPAQKFNFKASTLTHIAELKTVGQETIENQFIDRLYRQQTNYHYEKYIYEQKKEQTFQATLTKRHDCQKNSVITQPTNLMNGSANLFLGLRAESTDFDRPTATRDRFKPKKAKNVVQEQLKKIERLDKESRGQRALLK